jgi:uncharacterized protein (DUF736 family)
MNLSIILCCVLDDPSFVSPVQVALFDQAGGADLVWKRFQ